MKAAAANAWKQHLLIVWHALVLDYALVVKRATERVEQVARHRVANPHNMHASWIVKSANLCLPGKRQG